MMKNKVKMTQLVMEKTESVENEVNVTIAENANDENEYPSL